MINHGCVGVLLTSTPECVVSPHRAASKAECVEAGNESVKTRDQSIKAGEKHNDHVIIFHNIHVSYRFILKFRTDSRQYHSKYHCHTLCKISKWFDIMAKKFHYKDISRDLSLRCVPDTYEALQLIPLAAFGAVDEPLASCVMVHFEACGFKMSVCAKVWYSGEDFFSDFLPMFMFLDITQVLHLILPLFFILQ